MIFYHRLEARFYPYVYKIIRIALTATRCYVDGDGKRLSNTSNTIGTKSLKDSKSALRSASP